jgi:hypothetical protein
MVTEPAFELVSVTVSKVGLPTRAADPKLSVLGLAVSGLGVVPPA